MKEKVLKFINNYKHISKKEIEYAFNNGNCYWFAHILHTVFNGEIYYLPIENHFICKIEDEYYDINGCVDESFNYRMDALYSWKDYCEMEPSDSARVANYCIYYHAI